MDKTLESSVNNQEEFENKTNEDLSDLKNEVNSNDKEKISVHGFIRIGDVVFPDFSDKFSDKFGHLTVMDIRHNKSGLGIILCRADDFGNNKVSVLNPNWSKSFGKNKNISFSVGSEFAFFDDTPWNNGITPRMAGTFNTENGWTFDETYFRKIQPGTDSHAFRTSITKKINDALELTAQGWYESGYDKHFYGNIITNIDLGSGLGVELRCTAKNGKLIPTRGVLYKF